MGTHICSRIQKAQRMDGHARQVFAIISSIEEHVIDEKSGEKKPGRKYPWGVALAREATHSDFHPLEQMLYQGYEKVLNMF
jgi:septin family protein